MRVHPFGFFVCMSVNAFGACVVYVCVCVPISMLSHVSSNCPFQLILLCLLRCALSNILQIFTFDIGTGAHTHMEMAGSYLSEHISLSMCVRRFSL